MNKHTLSSRGNSLLFAMFCICTFIYMEFIYHVSTFETIGSSFYFPILFAIPAGSILFLLTSVFPDTVNMILLWVFLLLTTFLYFAELIYTHIFKTPLLFNNIGGENLEAVAYYKEFLTTCKACLPEILFLLLPTIIYGILLLCKIKPEKKKLPSLAAAAIVFLIFSGLGSFCVYQERNAENSLYDNYQKLYDTTSAMESFGVITTLRLNLNHMLFPDSMEVDIDKFEIGPPVEVIVETTDKEAATQTAAIQEETSGFTEPAPPAEPVIDTSPNAMDIDFIRLAQQEPDKNRKALHQYFASIVPTNKNQYTGMFRGYNLIYLTAEAFSPYCVDKVLTPTLYKLVNEGFVFKNYYVPYTSESTCGGEYMNCTGLLPNPNRPAGVYSFGQTKDNYMPFALGSQLKRMGVTSYAYHNNSLSYYSRYLTLPNLGYIFKAASAGSLNEAQARSDGLLFEMEHPHQWPQSDLEMLQATAEEYITPQQPFHAYYMTVSGHLLYTFQDNSMSYKNQAAVSDLPYSDSCKAYIACNIELDKALEHLITRLDAAGVLDKTVICMSADHYPYGLTNEEISELAGHPVEENFELYKNNLILWNNAIKEPIIIEKPCSSIDILPTLSNLFGFTYDSRLLPGTDILSDSAAFVMLFNNRSIITDNYMYNSKNKQVTDLAGTPTEIPAEDLSSLTKKYDLMLAMNQLLLEQDYYNVIRTELDTIFTKTN